MPCLHRAHRPENLATRRDFPPPLTRHRQGSAPWATGPASPYLAGPVRAWTPSPSRVPVRSCSAAPRHPAEPVTLDDAQGSPYQPPRVKGYLGPPPVPGPGSEAPGPPRVEAPRRYRPVPWSTWCSTPETVPRRRPGEPAPGAQVEQRRRRSLPPLTGRGSPKGAGVPARPKYYYFVAGACRDITQ